jgi:hypothetical protein
MITVESQSPIQRIIKYRNGTKFQYKNGTKSLQHEIEGLQRALMFGQIDLFRNRHSMRREDADTILGCCTISRARIWLQRVPCYPDQHP